MPLSDYSWHFEVLQKIHKNSLARLGKVINFLCNLSILCNSAKGVLIILYITSLFGIPYLPRCISRGSIPLIRLRRIRYSNLLLTEPSSLLRFFIFRFWFVHLFFSLRIRYKITLATHHSPINHSLFLRASSTSVIASEAKQSQMLHSKPYILN